MQWSKGSRLRRASVPFGATVNRVCSSAWKQPRSSSVGSGFTGVPSTGIKYRYFAYLRRSPCLLRLPHQRCLGFRWFPYDHHCCGNNKNNQRGFHAFIFSDLHACSCLPYYTDHLQNTQKRNQTHSYTIMRSPHYSARQTLSNRTDLAHPWSVSNLNFSKFSSFSPTLYLTLVSRCLLYLHNHY